MKIDSKDISVVVQGPISEEYTPLCVKSIRKYLPDAEIILSTWEESNVEGLDYDVLLLNQDPGSVFIDNSNKMYNFNRQRLSTFNGLKKASRKYALKIRPDFVLTGSDFLEYFDKYQERCEESKILKKRVLVAGFEPPSDLPFFVSDLVFFGLVEDVLNIWDITPADEEEITSWFYYQTPPMNDRLTFSKLRYAQEQYLWLTFLRKYMDIQFEHRSSTTPQNIHLTELSFANNLVAIPFKRFCVHWLKVPNHKTTDMVYIDWMRLYKKYCDLNFSLPTWCALYEEYEKNNEKLNYHLSEFLKPIKNFFKWISRPLSILNYTIKFFGLKIMILFNRSDKN